MSLWARRPFVALRLLGPHGHYPTFAIRRSSHLYTPASEGPWCAVVQPPLPTDWELGESTVLVPEEVRLFSALTLSEADPWENGRPVITHWIDTHLDLGSDPDLNLAAAPTFERLQAEVDRIRATKPPLVVLYRAPSDSGSYSFADVGSEADALDILDNLDATDPLLLAGLARLLGGSRLLFAAHEMEEASLSLFVSMNAALEFLRLYLTEQGTGDVSFKDVYRYLATIYPLDSEIAEYYDYMYEHRLAATHPVNRHGEYWAPPLMADDVYHLQKHLILLYRHIVLGELPMFNPGPAG